jgi:hypothetical protein
VELIPRQEAHHVQLVHQEKFQDLEQAHVSHHVKQESINLGHSVCHVLLVHIQQQVPHLVQNVQKENIQMKAHHRVQTAQKEPLLKQLDHQRVPPVR